MKSFEKLHPLVLFYYFIVVIFITFMTMDPVLLMISFTSSIFLCMTLNGFKKTFKSILFSILFLIIIAITNPLFVHSGYTVLFYINNIPITKEAIIYGLFIGILFISVFYWFKAYNEAMTSDKFIFLFGNLIPKTSLLISLTLSFIPKLKNKYIEISESQKALGMYTSKKFVDRVKFRIRAISILITWSLESSIDSADSMQSRGYGLKGRTNYSNYKWKKHDTFTGIIILVLSILTLIYVFNGKIDYNFYPVMNNINISLEYLIFYAVTSLLMLLPTILNLKEMILWRFYQSKI